MSYRTRSFVILWTAGLDLAVWSLSFRPPQIKSLPRGFCTNQLFFFEKRCGCVSEVLLRRSAFLKVATFICGYCA